ncbi:unnamed protein product [Arabidopsis thaliana]|uniref:DC1 domain-containing protein n=1 Tax=Arabidopsis thaliana TaxID=3702 RepID=A0A654EGR0_ARATH|nr:unnamed protein product [Arabidopsis thaliana]
MDSESESKLISFISQLVSRNNTDSENISCMIQTISLVNSMDLKSQPKPESKLMSLVTQTISLFNSMDLSSQPEPLRKLISLIIEKLSHLNSVDSDYEPKPDSEFMSTFYETYKLQPRPEIISIIHQIYSLFISTDTKSKPEPEVDSELMFVHSSMDSDSDSDSDLDSEEEEEEELISLLSEMYSLYAFTTNEELELRGGPEELPKFKSFISLTSKVITLVRSLDLDYSEPEPESEFISVVAVVKQIMSFANSISNSEPEWEFISSMTEMIRLISSIDLEPEWEPPMQLVALFTHTFSLLYYLDRDSELYTLIAQIIFIIDYTDSEPESEWGLDQLMSLSPQWKVQLVQGKFHVTGKIERKNKEKGKCQPENRHRLYLAKGEEASHFFCKDCNGEDHIECEKTPVEVKHLLHPKHSLQLVSQKSSIIQTRKCFCCDEDLKKIFYYCTGCDYAMNIACAEKPPVLFIDRPKWHADTLALFPRQAFLTCNVCAVADSSSPIYMCPPCDFVVHLRCTGLPRVIRISRHRHRISFTTSFDEGDWSCGVCRRKIDNDYGGFSCFKDGCSYAAHSRCATQKNMWDGIDLEGVPEEIEEEEVEPFVTISKGVIHHFSHQNHHLRLDENRDRIYDENKLSYNPIHPHLLSLMGGNDDVRKYEDKCSACPWPCIAGFSYECRKEGCSFKLHVQCATISEPLVHGSHIHPLFLTSKPGEQRSCSVCKDSRLEFTNETFNCIECEFALCFGCATLPQKVRYKHDKHILTLSYGKETSTMTYWCEVCEEKVNPKDRFYMCDDYCCVTLHIRCLIGKDLYMKPGALCFSNDGKELRVLPNNHMSRPFCPVLRLNQTA